MPLSKEWWIGHRSKIRFMRRATRVSLFLILLLSACNLPIAADCARPEVFCVGLVTAFGKVDDHGLNQSAWEGVVQARDEGLIYKADLIETIDARDHAKNIRTFAENGYDLIVTVGLSLDEETRLAADEWPGAAFVGVNQPAGEPARTWRRSPFPKTRADSWRARSPR